MTLPHWVRLIRKGNQFTARHSSDGMQWEAVVARQDPNEPTPIEKPMNETVHIGLAVSSHNTTRTAEARISNVHLTGSTSPSGPFVHSKDISLEISPDNSTSKEHNNDRTAMSYIDTTCSKLRDCSDNVIIDTSNADSEQAEWLRRRKER